MVDMQKYGEWAFLAGVIIAILAGLAASALSAAQSSWITLLLVVLGIIVGLLNITEKQTTPFLIAAIALMAGGVGITSFANLDLILNGLGTIIADILTKIVAFVAPAAIIVALKSVYTLGTTWK